MNEMTEVVKKCRGLGKKPAMSSTSIRMDIETLEWYKSYYGNNMQKIMREVLFSYMQAVKDAIEEI